MLFTSGRSAGPKKAAKGKKAAPAKGGFFGGGASAKKAAPPPVDDEDLFVHEGTKGFQGDEFPFVVRSGLASLAVSGREVNDVEVGFAEDDVEVPDKVAMLFTSGRSASPKKATKGKKAPAKGGFFGGGASAKKAAPPPVDDEDLFVHEGTKGFQGDEFPFVVRSGLASLAVSGREVSDVEVGFEEDEVEVPDKVAMLFTSGRSAGPKKAAKGKKAPAKGGFFGGGGAAAKKPARAPAVDDD